MDYDALKIIYSNIISGVSKSSEVKGLYIKHLSLLDTCDLDVKFKEYLNRAVSEGSVAREDKEKEIIEKGEWTEAKDLQINNLQKSIENSDKTLKLIFGKSDREMIEKSIQKNTEELNKLQQEKSELIGYTAEEFAVRKVNEDYIFYSFFKDAALKTPFFTTYDFDYLPDLEMTGYIALYNKFAEEHSNVSIKKISIRPFFLNSLVLANEDAYKFFGKPISKLTLWQAELFSYGKYFKNLLSEMKTPPTEEMLEDPDKIVELYENSKRAQDLLSKTKGDSVSFVGASVKEMNKMGVEGKVVNYSKLAKEKGGKLNMSDMMKI